MGVEQPAIAAVIARLADPKVSLAAYGGIVFPIAMMIEAPVIMLLSASTELSRDRASHRSLQAFTHRIGGALTLLHLFVAVTPAYDVLVHHVLAAPAVVAEEARIGLIIMLPWTWSIAWRRQGQGVLIRYGRSRTVAWGTAARLLTSGTALAIGVMLDGRGVVVGAAALSCGVLFEGFFVAWKVRPVVANHLNRDDPNVVVLKGMRFLRFYVPLAMVPMVSLVIQPIGAAAIGRMPHVVDSLAVWPVVIGILFLLQTPGLAMAEVVVAMIEKPGGRAALRTFSWGLGLLLLVVTALIAATPMVYWWFDEVSSLSPALVAMAVITFRLGIPVPAFRVAQSWFQGRLVAARQTRAVSEAVLLFGMICVSTLMVGVWMQSTGVYVASLAFAAGRLGQTVWIAYRARSI